MTLPLPEDAYAFPASFAQQRLWFLDQLESGTAVYNIPQAFRLKGKLKLELLERSFATVVERHESLRTTFSSDAGSPLQVVDDASRFSLNVVDLSHLGEEERLSQAKEMAADEAAKGFDLAKGPLLCATAYTLAEDDHVLFFNVSHIVCDGWSLALLFSELSRLYAAFAKDEPSPLGEQEIQYADYAFWQQEFFVGEELETELKFWREYLAGDLPALSLPFDHNRPAEPSTKGDLIRFNLNAEQHAAIKSLAKQEKTSLYMTLLAAFQTFLHRISGEKDILIGSPIANRDREEIREAIGFYTNTVVFRGDLSGSPSFRQLLGTCRNNVLSVLAHQELPLERIVEAINPDRRSGDNPIFQVMFAVQQAPESAFFLPDVEISAVDVHSRTSKFDLLLEMQELKNGMQCFLEYATDLFDADSAKRLAAHFEYMLDQLVANPDLSISEIPLLNERERHQLLNDWNDTRVDFDRAKCLHHLVEAQAALNPEKVAVEADGKSLTYSELDQRANRLANYLSGIDAGPDVMIGVYLDRSVDMMVSLLGILKSGSAYLPLDPSFPSDRIAYMLEDSSARMVISETALEDTLPRTQAKVVWIDTDWPIVEACEATRQNVESVTPENLAYVIYTSGSTGKPKGVKLPHRAVVNFLGTMAKRPGMTSDDSLLAVTTLSFDISVLELFLPLSCGAKVIVATKDEAMDGAELLEVLDSSAATMMQATPATWRLLQQAGWQGHSTLRKVLVGGEAWPAGLARELLDRVAEVWNMYGPTETTIWSTCAQVKDADEVLIGTPIANTQTYVVDRQMQPVVVGAAGELLIGGDGLAHGYHNLPEMTADRFIDSPFGEGRLYRTGDSVKYRVDGSLEFLGRLDNQVKVRGYRIELGEIESVLEKHDSIKQPLVIVWDGGDGDQRLVAYIVYQDGHSLTGSELRKYLRKDLPDYMLPHLFVEMDELPLTANGKVDRRALPNPLKQGQSNVLEFVEPRTEPEKFVAELWQSVLGVERVGLYDNFYDLGGHSLLSIQVTFAVEKATGYRIDLRAMVFQNLEQIASELPSKEKKAAEEAEVKTQEVELPQVEPTPKGLPSALKALPTLGKGLFARKSVVTLVDKLKARRRPKS
jgi:amino acid adenylation domain-containing protein